MAFMKGDDVFPPGAQPRSCIVCGQYERGRGWRMGFAKSAHGRKHINDGTAREVIRYHTYDYVLTTAGAAAATALAHLDSDRCKTCGLLSPKHTRRCHTGIMKRFADAEARRRIG